eukprot:461201_1
MPFFSMLFFQNNFINTFFFNAVLVNFIHCEFYFNASIKSSHIWGYFPSSIPLNAFLCFVFLSWSLCAIFEIQYLLMLFYVLHFSIGRFAPYFESSPYTLQIDS